MKRTLFALALSILIHILAFAAVATVQLLSPPKKQQMKVMYIKPVTLPKTQIKQTKKIDLPKTSPKTEPIVPKNHVVTTPKIDKIAIKPKVDNLPKAKSTPKPVITPTPQPVLTPAPIEFETPKPVKTAIANKPKKLTPAQIKEQEMQKKVATLKSIPSVKNNKYWTEARLRRLELPPGIDNWNDVKKLTEFFDTQYKWTYTPPALGDGKTKDPDVNPYVDTQNNPSSEPVEPTHSPTDDNIPTWKEYKEVNNDYSIRFTNDNIGFIAYFKENEKKVEITYFPYTSNVDNKETDIKIPENTNPEDLKNFVLPLTKEDLESRKNPEQDKIAKEQLIRDIIRTYKQQINNKQ